MSQRNVDDDLDWEYAEQQFERLREALAQLRRYEAVIEAARQYLKLSKSPPELYVGFLEPEVAAYLNLREALRALNKAEAGDE